MGRFKSQAPQSQHHGASSLRSKSGSSDLSPSLTPSPMCLPLASHFSTSHPATPHLLPSWPKRALWPLHPSSGSTAAPWCLHMKPGHPGPTDRAQHTLAALPFVGLLLQSGGRMAPLPSPPGLLCCSLRLQWPLPFASLVSTTNSRTFRAPGKSLSHRAPASVPRSCGRTGEDTEGLGLVPGQLPFPTTTSGRGAPAMPLGWLLSLRPVAGTCPLQDDPTPGAGLLPSRPLPTHLRVHTFRKGAVNI